MHFVQPCVGSTYHQKKKNTWLTHKSLPSPTTLTDRQTGTIRPPQPHTKTPHKMLLNKLSRCGDDNHDDHDQDRGRDSTVCVFRYYCSRFLRNLVQHTHSHIHTKLEIQSLTHTHTNTHSQLSQPSTFPHERGAR